MRTFSAHRTAHAIPHATAMNPTVTVHVGARPATARLRRTLPYTTPNALPRGQLWHVPPCTRKERVLLSALTL